MENLYIEENREEKKEKCRDYFYKVSVFQLLSAVILLAVILIFSLSSSENKRKLSESVSYLQREGTIVLSDSRICSEEQYAEN